jgi:hypothetical protein
VCLNDYGCLAWSCLSAELEHCSQPCLLTHITPAPQAPLNSAAHTIHSPSRLLILPLQAQPIPSHTLSTMYVPTRSHVPLCLAPLRLPRRHVLTPTPGQSKPSLPSPSTRCTATSRPSPRASSRVSRPRAPSSSPTRCERGRGALSAVCAADALGPQPGDAFRGGAHQDARRGVAQAKVPPPHTG